MDKISFHKKVVIVLISVLLVVLASAFFVNRAIQNIVHEVSEASKPDQRLVLLKGMMYDIADAENSVKSYSLTKNESYLDDYNLEINEVNYKLLQLQEIGDEGSDLANNLPKIDSLVNEKFNVLDELLLVQSKRSADVILQKVLEKVDGINEKQENPNENGGNEVVGEEKEEKEKFFKRLFGNRKKDKNGIEESEVVEDEKIEEKQTVETSFSSLDKELGKLKAKETEFEVELKMMELALIQKDKLIMDQIIEVVQFLEKDGEKSLNEKIGLADEKRKETRTWIALFSILTLVLLSLAGYIVYIYVKKNEAYKKALRGAKHEAEIKNIEITDSINYAKRIQAAIMPDDKKIRTAFPNSFIYYKPKDIVAGDFYWLVETDNYYFIAAADCTGHGVPGAMVSVACSGALNRSVKEFGLREPAKILSKCRELVIEAFEQGNDAVYDGMDIALCRFDKASLTIQYAGANNSLYVVSGGILNEIKADKQPVARFYKTSDFKNHELTLKKGDNIYLFTDGYADQFGGPKQKKFMYKQLKNLLTTGAAKSPQDQYTNIDQQYKNWIGKMEQIDDICIIGIRV